MARLLIKIVIVALLLFISLALVIKYRKPGENKPEEFSKYNLIEAQGGRPIQDVQFNTTYRYLIIYFDSTCETCAYEIHELEKNIGALHSVNIIFVSRESIDVLAAFKKAQSIFMRDNIYLFHATNDDFSTRLNAKVTPSFLILTETRHLIRSFIGETKIATLIKTLKTP